LRGDAYLSLVQIEAIGIHDLGPYGNKVVHGLFFVVILGTDYGIRPKNRVRTEYEIHSCYGLLDLIRLAITDFIQVVTWNIRGQYTYLRLLINGAFDRYTLSVEPIVNHDLNKMFSRVSIEI